MKLDDKIYKALVVNSPDEQKVEQVIAQKRVGDLPEGDVLIEVHYSSMNYKDAMSAMGKRAITRSYPHTPGIDAAGVVAESFSSDFKEGETVMVTGYDLGMNTSGGYQQYIRVPAKWVVRLPNDISPREAMIYATAGFTAASAILEFQENGIKPDSGKVLVNGASGAVGTMAIAMLAKLGYDVVAASGNKDVYGRLYATGAKEIIGREELIDESGKPLLKKKWAAALDNVGGRTLSNILRSVQDYGIVCNCGMVESSDFSVSVFPFILRGIRLVGIASAETQTERRLQIWDKIFGEYRLEEYNFLVKEVALSELMSEINLMWQGKQYGRVLVNLRK